MISVTLNIQPTLIFRKEVTLKNAFSNQKIQFMTQKMDFWDSVQRSCISTIFEPKKASANDKWARLSYYQKPTKDPPKRALKKLENTFHFSKYY